MKISRDGFVPQVEPDGGHAGLQTRLGGLKRLLQSTNFPMQAIVVGNTSITVWVTSQWLRRLFLNDPRLYALAVAVALLSWLAVYYIVILPGEQAWGQGQSQRVERSPLKTDTEHIRKELEAVRDELDAITQEGDE